MIRMMTVIAVLACAWLIAPPSALAEEAAAGKETIKPVLGDDGLYKQAWFLESFLDLREDVTEAAGQGKRYAVIWEQKGCPYCRDTHTINFADPEINKYVRDNFVVVQLNLWGDREVTDFDGEAMSEKNLAKKWGVIYTPTIHFFEDPDHLKDGAAGPQQLAAVMPGYFRPFHFHAMFEYVKERGYENQHFQKYIAERAARFRDEGRGGLE